MKHFILFLVIKCMLFTDNYSFIFATATDRPTDNEAVLQNVLSELKEIREKNIQMENRLAGLQHMELRLEGAEKHIEELQSANDILHQTVAELADHCGSTGEKNDGDEKHETEESFIQAPIEKVSLHNRKARQIYGQAVAFTAIVGPPTLSNLGIHHTIVFDNTITNVGNAYHTTTGIFTAPYTGVYVFVVRGMEEPGQHMYLALIKDGQSVNDLLIDGIAGYNLAQSKLWTLELTKGSEVWVRTNTAGSLHGGGHSMFSGFLLYSME